MLEHIDLSREVPKDQYKAAKEAADLKLTELQRQTKALGIPVVVVFEGWSAAGKGTLINKLILPLDPRGFSVYSMRPPTQVQRYYPFLRRFWQRIPARGRWAVFDRSWNRRVTAERVEGTVRGKQLRQAFEDIRSFERQLAAEGTVIIKFFLHISQKEQKRRFDRLRKNPATSWRIDGHDLRQQREYDEHLKASDEMLSKTDTHYAPWTVVEAHDRRFATLKIFTTMIDVLERRIESAQSVVNAAEETAPQTDLPQTLKTSVLDSVDLSLTLTREEYDRRILKAQETLRDLEHKLYQQRVPVIIAYEGWDAAGKGGNIRRLTQKLDPRGYQVIPIAAPNDTEKAHHYLWRFWVQMPKAGHIAIFDRTWYGRVLVERVEGFCTEPEWRRAYREINEMEEQLTHYGTVLLKFWLHIDPEEQLRRFTERQNLPHKNWKITDEDWRNREKLPQYKTAVEEMLYRTSTPTAPWTVVESNCKWYARVKVLEAVCGAIKARLK